MTGHSVKCRNQNSHKTIGDGISVCGNHLQYLIDHRDDGFGDCRNLLDKPRHKIPENRRQRFENLRQGSHDHLKNADQRGRQRLRQCRDELDQSVECRHQNATGSGPSGCESGEANSGKCHASADGEAGEAEHTHGFGDGHELYGHRTENRACESESYKSSIESSQPGNKLLDIHRSHKTDSDGKDRDSSGECYHTGSLA